MYRFIRFVLIILAVGLFLTTCDKNIESFSVNEPPVISSLAADPDTMQVLGLSHLTCIANDSDDDDLLYYWNTTGGNISGFGLEVVFTAPSNEGTYTITCYVSDGNGGEDSMNVIIKVNAVIMPNVPPEIHSITTTFDSIVTNNSTTIFCLATDSNEDSLAYTWMTTGGEINKNDARVTYVAPATAGKYKVTCVVSDGNGGEDSDSVNIFVEQAIGTVTDIDGNVYQTINIGTQWWMAENLKVTHYRDGDAIAHVAADNSTDQWEDNTTGAYCIIMDNDSIADIYGNLYNRHAIRNSSGLAPAGWHVPSYNDWYTLFSYLGGSNVAGGKLKEAGTVHWVAPNTGATNESGFTALPGGWCYQDSDEIEFFDLGQEAHFWTPDRGYYGAGRSIRFKNTASRTYLDDWIVSDEQTFGMSVRCIKD